MRFEDLGADAYAVIGAHSRLRDLASLARTSQGGRAMAQGARESAATALIGRVRRAVPAPYIYRYEGDYDPNVPDPGWGAANAPGHHFNYVQAFDFQNAEHSNPNLLLAGNGFRKTTYSMSAHTMGARLRNVTTSGSGECLRARVVLGSLVRRFMVEVY